MALRCVAPALLGCACVAPRGTAPRGVGGARVQRIAVPRFLPGAEIGLDGHRVAIHVALGPTGSAARPVHLDRP